jgi:hypothetical protein
MDLLPRLVVCLPAVPLRQPHGQTWWSRSIAQGLLGAGVVDKHLNVDKGLTMSGGKSAICNRRGFEPPVASQQFPLQIWIFDLVTG